jgi:hypothetical protein
VWCGGRYAIHRLAAGIFSEYSDRIIIIIALQYTFVFSKHSRLFRETKGRWPFYIRLLVWVAGPKMG